MNEAIIEKVYNDLMESITALTEGPSKEGHLAIKLTSMISIDIMTRVSRAQEIYLEDILQLWSKEYITANDIKEGLQRHGINATEDQVQ